jgi:hypothetical protein
MQTMEARRPSQQEQTHDNQSGGRFYTRCPTGGEKGRNWWSEMVDRQYLTYTHIYILFTYMVHILAGMCTGCMQICKGEFL